MVNNNSGFLLNGSTLKQVIYSSIIMGNLLFVFLHPIHVQFGVIAAFALLI
jgi:hypothetical protein